jgi:hypothetical protein
MRWELLAIGITALALGLAVAWRSLAPTYSPYRLVDPDQIFSGFPGSPKRYRDASVATKTVDELGYAVAGDARAIVVVSSKRPGNPNDLYDVDLSVRVLISPSAAKAKDAYHAENQQDRRLASGRVELNVPQGLRAEEAVAWSLGQTVAVQARYGNYLIRYVGKVVEGGYFPNQAAFFDALRIMDQHVKQSLESAA